MSFWLHMPVFYVASTWQRSEAISLQANQLWEQACDGLCPYTVSNVECNKLLQFLLQQTVSGTLSSQHGAPKQCPCTIQKLTWSSGYQLLISMGPCPWLFPEFVPQHYSRRCLILHKDPHRLKTEPDAVLVSSSLYS